MAYVSINERCPLRDTTDAAAAAKRRLDAQKERETTEETDCPKFEADDAEHAVRDTAVGEDAASNNMVDYTVNF